MAGELITMTVAVAGREAALAHQALAALKPHFRIYPEVWGTHPTGKRLRIDAILQPRDPSPWSRSDIALGVEFKAPTDRDAGRRDRKENAKIISQCIDYSLTTWDGIGPVPIFFCPGFSEIRGVESDRDYFGLDDWDYNTGFTHGIGFLMAAVMGQNNVGELIKSDHLGWACIINGTHRIWSERYGVGEGKRNKLLRQVGSR
jgi:hypothetical protein